MNALLFSTAGERALKVLYGLGVLAFVVAVFVGGLLAITGIWELGGRVINRWPVLYLVVIAAGPLTLLGAYIAGSRGWMIVGGIATVIVLARSHS